MQNTKNNQTTKNYILTLTKEIGKLWMIEDINPNPVGIKFETFFNENLSHDIGKLTFIGAVNYVLDILAGDGKRMDIEFKMAAERMELPDYVEFELVDPSRLAAKYHVNNCPGCPQLEAWFNASAKEIFKAYPAFAYIRKK